MIDLTKTLLSQYQKRPRTVGRYNASDIWAIANKYLTPQMFIDGEDIDFVSAYRMWSGTWSHKKIEELLVKEGWQTEIKKEFSLSPYPWVIVGKVDAINDKEILELKTSDVVMEKAKSWHEYQAKLYCSIFDMPVCRVVQPVATSSTLYLKELAVVKNNKKWFYRQLEIVDDFHATVSGCF